MDRDLLHEEEAREWRSVFCLVSFLPWTEETCVGFTCCGGRTSREKEVEVKVGGVV